METEETTVDDVDTGEKEVDMIMTCPTCGLVIVAKGKLNPNGTTTMTTTCLKCLRLYTVTVDSQTLQPVAPLDKRLTG